MYYVVIIIILFVIRQIFFLQTIGLNMSLDEAKTGECPLSPKVKFPIVIIFSFCPN